MRCSLLTNQFGPSLGPKALDPAVMGGPDYLIATTGKNIECFLGNQK
jgi:hypothetical protein